MNKKLFGGLLLAFTMLVGCKKEPVTPPEPEVTYNKISEALTMKNNDSINIKDAVVFGVANNGFFVNDGTGSIFVLKDNSGLHKGETVALTEAKVGVSSGRATIKGATIEKSTTVSTPLAPVDFTIEQILALDSDNRTSYANYYNLVGVVAKDAADQLTFVDDNGRFVYFATNFDQSVVSAFLGQRVTMPAVVYQKGSSTGWEICFVDEASAIVSTELTWAQKVEDSHNRITNYVQTTISGAIALPKSHPVWSEIHYTWSSNDPTVIEIVNNAGVVHFDEQDHNVTLTVVISNGTDEASFTYDILSKGITHQSVKSLIENPPVVNLSVVKSSGVVIAKTNNQSLTLYGIIVQDPDNPEYTIQVDLEGKADQEACQFGDVVNFTGYYRTMASGDRPTIKGNDVDYKLIEFAIVEHNHTYSYIPYFTIETNEDMIELTNNWSSKYCGRLIEFKNPLAYWTIAEGKRVGTSYLVFTYDEKSLTYKLNGKDEDKICVIYQNTNGYLGTTKWADDFGGGYSSSPTQYNASFYAIPSYYTSGTIAIMSIPSIECFFGNDKVKDMEAYLDGAVASSTKTEQIALPSTHNGIEITWTSSNTSVIANDGTPVPVEENTSAVLTATFIVDGVTHTYEKNITVMSSIQPMMTVSQLAQLEADGVNEYRVTGTVVGYIVGHAGSSTGLGVYLSDGTSVMAVRNSALVWGASKTNDAYVCKLDGQQINLGDVLTFTNVEIVNKGVEFKAGETAFVEHTTIMDGWFNPTDVTTINNDAELAALMLTYEVAASGAGSTKVIKIVGTNENPFYIGANNTTYIMALYYLNEGENAVKNYPCANTPEGKSTFFLVLPNLLGHIYDKQWVYDNTPVTKLGSDATNDQRSSMVKEDAKKYAFVGEMYFIFEYGGSNSYPYMYFSPVGGLNNVSRKLSDEAIQAALLEAFPSSLVGGEAYEFVLPTLPGVSEISVSGNNDAILNPNAHTTSEVNENTEVTLTINYLLNGVAKSATLVVTVRAPKPLTVSELVAQTDMTGVYTIEGVYLGSVAAHGGTMAKYSALGFYLGDETGIIEIQSNSNAKAAEKDIGVGLHFDGYATYSIGETVLTYGTKIKITKLNVTEIGKSAQPNSDSVFSVVSTNATLASFAPTNLDFTITGDAELAAYIATTAVSTTYTKYIKLVGTNENPIYVNAANGNYAIAFYYLTSDDAELATVKYYKNSSGDDKTLIIQPYNSAPGVGSEWLLTHLTCITSISKDLESGSLANKAATHDDVISIKLIGEYYFAVEYAASNTVKYISATLLPVGDVK